MLRSVLLVCYPVCSRVVLRRSKASLLDLELHFNDLKLHSSGTIEDVAYKWGFLKDGASGGKDQPNLSPGLLQARVGMFQFCVAHCGFAL